MRKAIVAGIALTALFSSSTAVAQPTITGVERRITTNLSDQFDPAISGKVVVYTDMRGYDADVWYYDLASGTEHPATTAPGDQQLTDVSDGVIVYTDLSTMHVYAYDVATEKATDLNAGRTSMAYDPAVGQGLVAWQDNRDGNYEIYARDLLTGEERRLSDSPDRDERPDVDHGVVVWDRCDMTGFCKLFGHDWATGVTRQLTEVPGRDERAASIKNGRVVFEGVADGEKDIYLLDLAPDWTVAAAAGTETHLSLPGSQGNPNVSGDVVSFDDTSTGMYHVRLWHVPSGSVFDVAVNPASQQFLNDIDGNRVVYTDDRNGQLDIYLYEFTLNLVLSVNPTGFDFGDVEVYTRKSTCVNVTNVSAQDVFVVPSLTAGTSPPFLVDLPPSPVAEGYRVQAGTTFCVPVVFLPIAVGPASTDLTISAFNPKVPLATVHLTGNGIPGFGSIDVFPPSYAFGDVEIGTTASTHVTISNVSDFWPLTVTGIGLATGSSPSFDIGLAPSCPFTLPPSSGGVMATADVELLFRPAAPGPASAVLNVRSDDTNHALVTVTTTGTGVSTPTPGESAAAILEFFDGSVANGRLGGSGPGNSAKGRLGALRSMIKAAADLIANGRYAEACQQLLDAYQRVDGLPRPPDFASGPAAAELAAQILALRAQIGCQ